MANKLIQMYDYAAKEGGATAKFRLAMMTCIPSAKAATEPDSPANIQKFKIAIKQITGKDIPIV